LLDSEADRLGAALVLVAVSAEERWWIVAASDPSLTCYPDPIELWHPTLADPDAGRAPAAVCMMLGRRPVQRWVADVADAADFRIAVYWTDPSRVSASELEASKDRIARLAWPSLAPTFGVADQGILALIVESMPIALVFFDCEGLTVAANRSARVLLGLRPIDMAPRAMASRLEELGVQEALPSGPPANDPPRILHLDGRQFAATSQAMRGDWGNGVVWRIEDVTEARLAEAKLHDTKRALLLREVSGGIGHEFNNLLSRVMGVAEDIQEEVGAGPVHGLAETLIETAERGAQVVRRLMTYAGSVAPDLRPVDLEVVLAAWLAAQDRPEVVLATGDCNAQVLLDPALLKVCLDELLKNARQAGAMAVRVGCSWDRGEHILALSVADDGGGMDGDSLGRATQPFFTTRSVGEGVGLGLSMVKGALNQWGGRLRIVSEPGKGTTVTLLLPTLGSAGVADP
jgi:signal transduction histidine kinase